MTAFAPANLPAGINTVERLHAWSGGILYDLYKFLPYKESESAGLVPVITLQDGVSAERTERQLFRVSLKLKPSWRVESEPFFLQVEEFSDAPIPELYLPSAA